MTIAADPTTSEALPNVQTHVVRGACPHDCPDNRGALLLAVSDGVAIKVQSFAWASFSVNGARQRCRLHEVAPGYQR